MILLLFLYDTLYASSHDLESDYPLSGLKDENSPIPDLGSYKICAFKSLTCNENQLLNGWDSFFNNLFLADQKERG